MYPDGRRKNFYDGKSHMQLSIDVEKCRQTLSGAKLAHFNIPNWARYLLPLANELGIKIACDIRDVVDLNDPYRQDFIQNADVLLMSGVNFQSMDEIAAHFIARSRIRSF